MPRDTDENVPLIEKKVVFRTKAAYSLGHVFNDLVAVMWFSYTLIFLQRVVLLEPVTAGSLMLLGQVIDAFMTPVFGLLVDKYANKKFWHVIGSIMVTLSFPVIFGSFTNLNSSATMALLVTSIIFFQTGWAVVQISHLSMIPSLSKSSLMRAELTGLRYSAQVTAAVAVFIVTWIVLPTGGDRVMTLGPRDDYKFRNIVLVITAFGLTATILFHIFLKSHLLEESSDPKPSHENGHGRIHESPNRLKRSWVGTGLLIRVALLYVASRLFITLATVYLPLYVEEADVGGKQALATVPLVFYLSSFITALFMKQITYSCGTKTCYMIGALVGIIAAIVARFSANSSAVIYAIAILIGAGSSITMVTSLSLTADLIGPRIERSAFVYSVVTCFDKIVSGLVVIMIEKWRCTDRDFCPTYNRDTLALVCAVSMMIGLITLLSVSKCMP